MPKPDVVYPPDEEGGRRVRCDGELLGRALSLYEVMELLNSAGLNAAATDFGNTEDFDWCGDGPYSWEPAAPPRGNDGSA
jgi:hypothetical protein